MQSIFDKLLDNLVVAALVPSLIFFTLGYLLFGDSIPKDIADKLIAIFGSSGVFIIIMGVCLGLVLSYLSETIYWFYRGVPLPASFRNSERQNAKKLLEQIMDLNQSILAAELEVVDSEDHHEADLELMELELLELEVQRNKLYEYYASTFPPADQILPTRFGNLLATAESYPKLRYNMNGAQMWPRLKHVIPADSLNKIDQVNHEMAFLINSSLLSAVLGVGSWLTSILQLFRGIENIFLALFQNPSTLLDITRAMIDATTSYAMLGVLFFFASWLLYQLSLPIARRYAEMYRCVFDLFRFQLSEQLRFGCPASTDRERDHWAVIHAYLNSEPDAVPVKAPYQHPKKDEIKA